MISKLTFLSFLAVAQCADLWYDPVTDGSDDPTSLWTQQSGTASVSSAGCPNGGFCWFMSGGSAFSRTISTVGWSNIQLTYSMAAASVNGNGRYCAIEYSLGGASYVTIRNMASAETAVSQTYSTWGSSANDATLEIRVTAGGSGTMCYFDELRLTGVTAAPTVLPTAIPTASPTAIPTPLPTAIPTVSPTTASPTASTAVPTSAPSAAPTASPTTASPTIATTYWTDFFGAGSYDDEFSTSADLDGDDFITQFCVRNKNGGLHTGIDDLQVDYSNGEASDWLNWLFVERDTVVDCYALADAWDGSFCFTSLSFQLYHYYDGREFITWIEFETNTGATSRIGYGVSSSTSTETVTIAGNLGDCIAGIKMRHQQYEAPGGTAEPGARYFSLLFRTVGSNYPSVAPTTPVPYSIWTGWYGGGWQNNEGHLVTSNAFSYLTKVCGRVMTGMNKFNGGIDGVDGLKVEWSDGEVSDYYGGNTNNGESCWDLLADGGFNYTDPDNTECFETVETSLQYDAMDYIKLITSSGVSSTQWGLPNGGSVYTITAGQGMCVAGFKLRRDTENTYLSASWSVQNPDIRQIAVLFRQIGETAAPTPSPTGVPTTTPTSPPSPEPTDVTSAPTAAPTQTTMLPTFGPSMEPTSDTWTPTVVPTLPSAQPTTAAPTQTTSSPTGAPTPSPTAVPSVAPTPPTEQPTSEPTVEPTMTTATPTNVPTDPTLSPTLPLSTSSSNEDTDRDSDGNEDGAGNQDGDAFANVASSMGLSSSGFIGVIIGGAVLFLVVVVIVAVVCRKRSYAKVQQRQGSILTTKVQDHIQVNSDEIASPDTNTTGENLPSLNNDAADDGQL